MKITYLHLTNFMGIESLTLDSLASTVILVGPNGRGKTTVLNALRLLFCGRCFDAAGLQVEKAAQIGKWGDEAMVAAGIEIGDKEFDLCLTIGKTTTLRAEDGRAYLAYPEAESMTQIRGALLADMETKAQHLECAMNSRAYLLGPELGGILAELCGGTFTLAELEAEAGEYFPYLMDFAHSCHLELTAEDLPKLGDAAYKTRTQVKKVLAGAQRIIADRKAVRQPTDQKGAPIAAERAQSLQDALSGLRKDRDALIAEKAHSVDYAQFAEAKRKHLEAAEAHRVALEGKKLEVEAAKAEAEAKADIAQRATSGWETITQACEKAAKAVKEAEAEVARFAEAQACPTCGHSFPPDVLAKLQNDAGAKLEAARKEHNRMMVSAADATEKRAGHLRAADDAKKRYEVLDSECLTHAQQMASEKAFAERLPSKPPRENIDADIEAIETRIAAGEAKCAQMTQWIEKTKAEHEAAQAEAEIEHLEWIIREFRDGEFMKRRLSDFKSNFETGCNAILEPYGYSLAMEVAGKNVEVYLCKSGHRPAALENCSKGELVLAGWAVASAFGGNGPICVDDLDALSGDNKQRFLAELKQRAGTNPVFVAGAWTKTGNDIKPLMTFLEPASVIWIGGAE